MRALRLAKGLTQEQLAEAADMHWTFISGVERGIKDPRLTTIGRIARALGVQPARLFAGELPERLIAGGRSRRKV